MKLSPGVEWFIEQQLIRPSKKILSESNLIPAPEVAGQGGNRRIEVNGAQVKVIHRPRKEGR